VYLSHVYYICCMIMCTYALYTVFHACFPIQIYWYTCIYLISDLLSFSLYYLSFPVPACLDHITWSCTRVPVMHAIWLYRMYSLGLLTTLDPHVQILETRPWRPYCTWSVWRSGSVNWQLPIRTLLLPASPWSAREILILLLVSTFPYFIVYFLLLCLLVIIYSWDIISCLVIIVYLCY